MGTWESEGRGCDDDREEKKRREVKVWLVFVGY